MMNSKTHQQSTPACIVLLGAQYLSINLHCELLLRSTLCLLLVPFLTQFCAVEFAMLIGYDFYGNTLVLTKSHN